MSGPLVHGGIGGAIVEIALVLTILAVFFAVWWRHRLSSEETDSPEDEQ